MTVGPLELCAFAATELIVDYNWKRFSKLPSKFELQAPTGRLNCLCQLQLHSFRLFLEFYEWMLGSANDTYAFTCNKRQERVCQLASTSTKKKREKF